MYLYVVGVMVAQWWEHLPPPPMWPWFASWCRLHTLYVGWVCSWFRSLLCSKRFFSRFCSLPLSLKTNTSKFQSDLVRTDAFQQVLMRGMDMYIPVWFMSEIQNLSFHPLSGIIFRLCPQWHFTIFALIFVTVATLTSFFFALHLSCVALSRPCYLLMVFLIRASQCMPFMVLMFYIIWHLFLRLVKALSSAL